MIKKTFSQLVIDWFETHGRHHLPWQINPSPYRVWVSEIMLQQTQVNTVIPYFKKFMRSFPSIKSLALAPLDDVLRHWSGLGYYARARNLHKAAHMIYHEYHGRFPRDLERLMTLPGVGRSTAGAILSLAMHKPATILDGNVKRVLARYYAIPGWPGHTSTLKELWNLAEKNTPNKDCHIYTQAMMDIGATLCTRAKPNCACCPLNHGCLAHQQNNTSSYPGKKPRQQSRPQRQVQMLIIQNQSAEVLLEKRPPQGIWGSLWSFPECSLDTDVQHYCRQTWTSGVNITTPLALPKMTHQFTHFELEIHPILVIISKQQLVIRESSSHIWYKLQTTLPGGTPAVVDKLLARISQL